MSSLEQPIESQMTPENNFNPLSDAERKEYNELSFDTHSDPVKMARLKELQGRLDMQANINKASSDKKSRGKSFRRSVFRGRTETLC
jgi:hypothetical protein